MGMSIDEFEEYAKAHDCVVFTRQQYEHVVDIVNMYELLQLDYLCRLQADMVAMLTEIQLELDEMKITKVRSAGFAPYSKDPFRRGVNCSKEIIQQRINSLKAEVEPQESEDV